MNDSGGLDDLETHEQEDRLEIGAPPSGTAKVSKEGERVLKFNDIHNDSLDIFVFEKYVVGYRAQRVSRYCADDLSNDALYMFGLLQLQLLQHTR